MTQFNSEITTAMKRWVSGDYMTPTQGPYALVVGEKTFDYDLKQHDAHLLANAFCDEHSPERQTKQIVRF